MKSAFLLSKGLLCLYDKQNNIRLLVDMEFLFLCSTRHLTRSLRLLVSCSVKYSKRNSISTRTHVLFSMWAESREDCKKAALQKIPGPGCSKGSKGNPLGKSLRGIFSEVKRKTDYPD